MTTVEQIDGRIERLKTAIKRLRIERRLAVLKAKERGQISTDTAWATRRAKP